MQIPGIVLPFVGNFPIPIAFFGVAIILFTVYRAASKSDSAHRHLMGDYLEAEQAANFSRRKDPTPEEYMKANTGALPVRDYPGGIGYARAAERRDDVLALASQPMMRNAEKLNNRELKLKYGAANLDTIIAYEENYDRFIHGLLEWAAALVSLGEAADARAVLGAAIAHRCDRSQAFIMLSDLLDDRESLEGLREKAGLALSGAARERAVGHIGTRLGEIS